MPHSLYSDKNSSSPLQNFREQRLALQQAHAESSLRTHHRECSLSSLHSVGPVSPLAGNACDTQSMAASTYLPQEHKQPLTPKRTPLQKHFLSPHHNFYNGTNGLPTQHRNLQRTVGNADDSSPSTPPSNAHTERQMNDESNPSVEPWLSDYLQFYNDPLFWSAMPALDYTMNDAYRDKLYNSNPQFTSTATASTQVLTAAVLQNDVFAQRLQGANSQHLDADHRTPLPVTSREHPPIRWCWPLMKTSNAFGSRQQPKVMSGTASHMSGQKKTKNDASAIQQRFQYLISEPNAPKTIFPKDANLLFHGTQADAASPRCFGSMATPGRDSKSAYPTSHAVQQQPQSNFAAPASAGSVRQLPQPYPSVSQLPRKPSEALKPAEDISAIPASMKSSCSEYVPDGRRRAATDTGAYTCTYHGCTLRFKTLAKLQRHKRAVHSSAGARMCAATNEGRIASAAARNTQKGPHRCERIDPSNGKSCNTVFSRPYDLTRHEDTIHNSRKQKVRCHLCAGDKSFRRTDALMRHFRVCHPDHVDPSKKHGGGRRKKMLD